MIVPPTTLAFVATGLIYTILHLLNLIKCHFNRQVMMDEEWRVKMIFMAFTTAYVTRAVSFVVESICEKLWFTEKEIELLINFSLVDVVCYNLWDVVPLALIMHYHFKCYAA